MEGIVKDINCSTQNAALFVDLFWNFFCFFLFLIGIVELAYYYYTNSLQGLRDESSVFWNLLVNSYNICSIIYPTELGPFEPDVYNQKSGSNSS